MITIEQGHPLSLSWTMENLHQRGESWAIDQESYVAFYDGNYELDRLTPDVGLGIKTDHDGPWELHAYISDTSFFPVADLWYRAEVSMTSGELLLADDGVIRVTEPVSEAASRPVYPWDLINPGKDRAPREIRHARMSECRSCQEFSRGVCKICHCVMRFKTSMLEATCPAGKW